jgi:hypothetical protein
MLGFYDNRDDYNKFSRVYNRSNPFFPETPEWDWQWSSSELRRQYRDIKNSSDAQGRNANFTLGAALANRVLSAVDAWWCVKKYNMRFSPLAGTIRIRLKPSPSDLMRGDSSPGLSVSYSRSF